MPEEGVFGEACVGNDVAGIIGSKGDSGNGPVARACSRRVANPMRYACVVIRHTLYMIGRTKGGISYDGDLKRARRANYGALSFRRVDLFGSADIK